jgi:hypothetical protein
MFRRCMADGLSPQWYARHNIPTTCRGCDDRTVKCSGAQDSSQAPCMQALDKGQYWRQSLARLTRVFASAAFLKLCYCKLQHCQCFLPLGAEPGGSTRWQGGRALAIVLTQNVLRQICLGQSAFAAFRSLCCTSCVQPDGTMAERC